MIGNKRNFSLSIWDHKDNFLCSLKSPNSDLNGQSYNEDISKNIQGEKTLTFTIPAYIYDNNFQPLNHISNSVDSNVIGGFIENEKWNYIFNEQKIRYIEYDELFNKPIKIEEFVLKNYSENRNGYEKTIECTCESLAVYELSKVGWSINFDVEYIPQYELENNPEDFLQLDYWLKKIFYKETNLGRVSTTTECTYLLQGLQLRNSDGAPIASEYKVDTDGNNSFSTVVEPIASTTDLENYRNDTGWYWEIQAIDPRRVDSKVSISTLYEKPVIDRYIEAVPNYYTAFNYQKEIGTDDSTKELLPYPIPQEKQNELQYVTNIEKRLVTCERSNIFSIIQDLCETFEVWPYFEYEYNEQGKISSRKILFKTEAVNENIVFDFSYGKNLQSCSRVIDSNELVTKLIIPDTESNLDNDKILSIKQATANPTGEGYLYNFEYFYNIGALTRGETDEDSDEYKINLHCGKLKNYNNQITNLQKYLVPLYTRQMELQGDLSIQQASLTGLMDNIQSIQDKIDAIPSGQQIINSWSADKNQYNYIGELKTISTTTIGNETKYYINFGREDILYKTPISLTTYTLNVDNELIEGNVISVSSYTPRYFTESIWQTGTDVSDSDFTILDNDNVGIEPDYSWIGDRQPGYIKGIYLSNYPNRSYVRIRYQYAPLSYYYILIKDYWDKLLIVKEEVKRLQSDLQEINNKIVVNELTLNNLLAEKNELILQFEKEYKPFIREGYWEANEYQSQLYPTQLDTSNTTSIYEGLISVSTYLSELNLNSSLHNYTYYIDLNININNIDIDSIQMNTINPAAGSGNTVLPRYRGNDYEIFTETNGNCILGISPSLIDTYEKYDYDNSYYKSTIVYSKINGELITGEYNWINIDSVNKPIVVDRYIYLTDDNLLTDSIAIYGNNVNEDNLLEPFTDYSYSFDYAGYNDDGNRVDLSQQETYSENIHYDYITKITLKNTNKSNSFNRFIVNYNKETTLQFLYNDAVATSEKYAVPQITYDISVVDLSSLNGYKDYKPVLGQKVPIFDPEMRLNGYEGIITSIEKQLESPENVNITIATYKTRFEDIFQKLTATMTDVSYNQNELLNAANSFNSSNGVIKTEVFQKSLEENNFQIKLGTNNDITIDRQSGITLVDQDNNNAVKLLGNGIYLTDNYMGNDSQWKTGITGEGINANALVAGNIDTKNINIWNASEGQIRFIWNEQGLFAYGAAGVSGTSTNSNQDFVDYNKYVKYSYNGLQFSDNGRSALSLGWSGLSIDTQGGALRLDADNGLVLKNNTTTRLELGKLNQGEIYGLKLYNPQGEPTFQSDSDGNLWLSKYIKVGGSLNGSVCSQPPTAGIIGLTTSDVHNQMGVMRDTTTGDIVWNNKTLRFWAGRQTKTEYLSNLSLTTSELSGDALINWNNLSEYDPALARFKVDEDGNIIASGIDVGGWIGAGKILRSKDYEAILRSGDYSTSTPVFAIGKDSNNTDGSDYHFRVYQDGTLNIGDGQFVVYPNGAVSAQNIVIDSPNSTLNGGYIGGWAITSNGIEKISGAYKTGMYPVSGSTDYAIQVGTSTAPEFTVNGLGQVTASSIAITGGAISGAGININNRFIVNGNSGQVTASDIVITGENNTSNWIIDADEFQVSKIGQIGAGIIPLSNPSIFNYDNYDFSVSDGNVRFRGSIYAYYGSSWYQGVDSTTISIQGASGYTNVRVVKGLIVGTRS